MIFSPKSWPQGLRFAQTASPSFETGAGAGEMLQPSATLTHTPHTSKMVRPSDYSQFPNSNRIALGMP